MKEAQLQDTIVRACAVLQLPCFHIRDSRRNMGEGFPDLVIANWRQSVVHFWELKSEKGTIRPKQIEWMESLRGCQAVDVQLLRPVDLDDALGVLSSVEDVK